MKINSIILAGGKGLRFGQDKILEKISRRSLLEQVVAGVGLFSEKVIIVIAEERVIPEFVGPLKPEVVTDIYPGKGPLGGIYTGLAASDLPYNLVVAGDMPFLNTDLLRYMVQNAAGYDVVIPRMGRLVEPLHTVYAKSCLSPILTMMQRDDLSVNRLLNLVRVRYIDREEIDRFDPEHMSFFNINTKADLLKARRITAEKTHD